MIKLTLCPVVKPFFTAEASKPLDSGSEHVDHCRGSDDVIAVNVRVRRPCNPIPDASRWYMPTSPARDALAGQILDFYA
jgi:hypothetical protein